MWPQLVTEPDPWRSHLLSPGASSCPQTDQKGLRIYFMRALVMFTRHQFDPQVLLVCLEPGGPPGAVRAQQVTPPQVQKVSVSWGHRQQTQLGSVFKHGRVPVWCSYLCRKMEHWFYFEYHFLFCNFKTIFFLGWVWLLDLPNTDISCYSVK